MPKESTQESQSTLLEQTVRDTGVFRCLECGKCTAICPISRYDHHFSPRRTVGRALMRHDEALLTDDRLWTCLTCLHCTQVCPAGVAYSDLTLGVRTEARRLGTATVCMHGEAIHAWMRLMMDPALKQKRLSWLTSSLPQAPHSELEASSSELSVFPEGDLRSSRGPRKSVPHLETRNDSDTLYFVGCAPYYGTLFEPLGVDGDGIARSTVQILNALGVKPQVLPDERCCGHDLLWEGDVQGFRTLAGLNAALIRKSGAKRIVTSCPECARALKVDYPAYGIRLDTEVVHLAQLLTYSEWPRPNNNGASHHRQPTLRITYHDPCRLGRHMGLYDPPRQVLERLGLELIEMQRHRHNALCCGTNGWTHCTIANKAIQVDRLCEARATGAELLVAACIKCQIHLKCALQDRLLGHKIAIEVKDLATLVAERMTEGIQAEPGIFG